MQKPARGKRFLASFLGSFVAIWYILSQQEPRAVRQGDELNHGELYIIENVEGDVRSECGEQRLHEKTLDEIDPPLETSYKVKDRIEVKVARL